MKSKIILAVIFIVLGVHVLFSQTNNEFLHFYSSYTYKYYLTIITDCEREHFKLMQDLCDGKKVSKLPLSSCRHERFDSSRFIPLSVEMIDTLTTKSGLLFVRLRTDIDDNDKELLLFMPESRMTMAKYYRNDSLFLIKGRYSSIDLYADCISDVRINNNDIWERNVAYDPTAFAFTISDLEDKFKNGFNDTIKMRPPFRKRYYAIDDIELCDFKKTIKERLLTNRYVKGAYMSSFGRAEFGMKAYSVRIIDGEVIQDSINDIDRYEMSGVSSFGVQADYYIRVSLNRRHNVYEVTIPSYAFVLCFCP